MGIASMLRRWRARHLLIAWIVYWVVLLVVSLRSALGMTVRALTGPAGHGSIGASVENGNFILKVVAAGETWTGTTSLTAMALWFAGPPLVLFLVWLATRRAPVAERDPERDYRIS
jgi:hypothetical protein